MREPSFWRHDGLLPRLLSPLGAIYGAVAARRMAGTSAPSGPASTSRASAAAAWSACGTVETGASNAISAESRHGSDITG